jgi:hypothetical protein
MARVGSQSHRRDRERNFFIFLNLCMHNWFIDICRHATACVQLPLYYVILLDDEPRGPNLWEIKQGQSGCVP